MLAESMSGNTNLRQNLNRSLTAICCKETYLIYVVNAAGVITGAKPVTARIILRAGKPVTSGVILHAGLVTAGVIRHTVTKHICV